MDRLTPAQFPNLAPEVLCARYDRSALRTGIVHLGIGAFMRAHLAPVTQAAMAQGDLRWGILGVSLRQTDTRDALAPQQGLYTVALRDTHEDGTPRQRLQVVACVQGVLVAPENPDAVLELLARDTVRIASLTVTEKGYCHDPATLGLQKDHPDVVHDRHSHHPRSAIGYLVRGMERRRDRGLRGITLMSLDNLPSNGNVLRAAVLELAHDIAPSLADWIQANCSFPNSMVDRIVPRTTDGDRAQVSAALGAVDAWPVMAEPFLDWAVEDQFVADRPDWHLGGARFVEKAAPWETVKLRMVNGTHSSVAYLGVVAGWPTVDHALMQMPLRKFVESLLRDEIEPTLPKLLGFDSQAYRESLLRRFANPALAHKTQQIAMDGSQKLPQRLLGAVRDRLAAGASIHHLALSVAAWLHFLQGVDETGRHYPVDDPLAETLRRLSAQAQALSDPMQRARVLLQLPQVFGDLQHNDAFASALAPHLASLAQRGVVGTLEAL